MTSKNSFFKLMKEDLKRRVWTVVLSFYLFLMAVLTFSMDLVSGGSGTIISYLGPGNTMFFYLSIIIACVCGLQGFGYLFSKEKTDFYFSIPVKRRTLFWVAYINGVLIFSIPCIISKMACYWIAYSGGYLYQNREGLVITVMGILISRLGYLLLYNMVIIAVMLTGNLIISIVSTGILFFYGSTIMGFVIQSLSKVFFHTYYKTELLDGLARYASPLTLYSDLAGVDSYQDAGKWTISTQIPFLLATIIGILITFSFSYYLLKKRSAEAAGRAIAFPKSQSIFRTLLVIPLALMTGYFFILCSPSSSSKTWLLVGVIFGSFTFHGLLEVIFQFDIKGMISHKFQLLLTGIVCLGIVGSFNFDIWGYDSYFPREDQLQSVAISIKGLDDTEAEDEVKMGEKVDLMAETRLDSMELTGETMSAAYSWLETSHQLMQTSQETPLTYTTVAYHLKNGRTVYRCYSIESKEQLEQFDKIYASQEYQSGAFPLASNETAANHQFIWSNGIETLTLDLDDDEKEELLSIYKKELFKLRMKDLESEAPIGTLTLASGDTHFGEQGYIYPTFENTIAYLKSKGIPVEKRMKDYGITQIKISYYNDKYSGLGAYVSSYRRRVVEEKVYESKSEIEEIKEQLIYSEYAINPLLNPIDSTSDIMVKYKSSAGKTAEKVVCVFKKD